MSQRPSASPIHQFLFLFSASSRDALGEMLRTCPTDDPRAQAIELARRPRHAHRVAIVADTAEQLATDLRRASDILTRANDSRAFVAAGSAFYGRTDDSVPRDQTAYLFPGHGVKGKRLLTDLLEQVPSVRHWLESLGDATGSPPGAHPLTGHGLATTTLETVLLADLAMWVVLSGSGVTCDAMVGHSFGENAMVVASGMLDSPRAIVELLRNVRDTTPPLPESESSGALGMLALSAASRPVLEPLLTSDPPRAFISLDNCPQQIVVWGQAADLALIKEAVTARGEVVFPLPKLEQPVHTPLCPLTFDSLRALYQAVPIGTSRVPAWSAATVDRFPDDPDGVRNLLARQWLMPVRFRELVERLYAEGIRTFVEVGPGDRLCGFVRNTLRGARITTIATNTEGRATWTQLLLALAQLFVRGHDVDLTNLHSASQAGALADRTGASPRSAMPEMPLIPDAGHVDRRHELVTQVAAEVAGVLGLTRSDDLDLDCGFFELGLDSIGCLELVDRLEQMLGRSVPQTWPFDYPTPRLLAAALDERSPQPDDVAGPRRAMASFPESPGIAIVGIGCRFPGGADSPERFFTRLLDGCDAVGTVPPDRWHPATVDPHADAESRHRTAAGAFLDNIREFDAGFFGISPREALTLDPQQRLLLEVTWEALEHAAIDPHSLARSRTGVFVGISNADYAARLSMPERLEIGGYLGTGNTNSTAAGRVAFFLGLQGACLAVDTACSSSLTAVHLACQSLRRGESQVALAGGVNLLINPETTIFLSHALALSPTGRCRTFDAAADGYVRGEGCGMVVLKRLPDAIADGDLVLAVIRGTAMNHDGRTSGLTVPNGLAQESVVRAALDEAECAAHEIDYIEAHGTATSLGDPIEVNALGRVFGGRPPERRALQIGSVKTNIGHLEAAAGIASLIKVALQLSHRQLVPSLHYQRPNPRIDTSARALEVVTTARVWPGTGNAGVSSFGISGTNVHVVMTTPVGATPALAVRGESPASIETGDAPGPPPHRANHARRGPRSQGATSEHIAPYVREEQRREAAGSPTRVSQRVGVQEGCSAGRMPAEFHHGLLESSRQAHLLAVSAPSPEALRQIAARLADHFASHPSIDLAAASRTVTLGRAHFGWRRALVARTLDEAIDRLREVAREGSILERRLPTTPRIAFLCTGQGAQRPGMGRDLYEREPEFRRVVDLCCSQLQPFIDRRLTDVMFGADSDVLNQTQWTQPALFVFEYALATLWQRWGIVPKAVLGHSVGELVAACLAGVFDLDSGLRLVASRARLMQSLPVGGAMLAVRAPVETVRRLLDLSGPLGVAAINASDQVVLSGPSDAVHAAGSTLHDADIVATPLVVSHAFHSPLMAPIVERFRTEAQKTAFAPPRMPVYSNLTGERADATIASADYWATQLREPVRFADNVKALVQDGIDVGLELGPQAVLAPLAARSAQGRDIHWLASVQSPSNEHDQVLDTLARLYEAGAEVNWKAFHGHVPGPRVDLPTYPFQRDTYWLDGADARGPHVRPTSPDAPLLGEPRTLPLDEGRLRFESSISRFSVPMLAGATTLPVSAYLALASALDRGRGARGAMFVTHFHIASSLKLESTARVIQTVLESPGGDRSTAAVFSLVEKGQWREHATWEYGSPRDVTAMPSLAEDQESDAVAITGAEFYERSRRAGFEINDARRVVETVRVDRFVASATLRRLTAHASHDTRLLPLYDGCFQVLFAGLMATGLPGPFDVPRVARLVWSGALPDAARLVVDWTVGDNDHVHATMIVVNERDGTGVVELSGIEVIEAASSSPGVESRRQSLQARLRTAPADERAAIITTSVQSAVGAVLRLPAERPLDPHEHFQNVGLDSLMALQLSTMLRRELDAQVSVTSIIDGGSVESLVRTIMEGGDSGPGAVPSIADVAAQFVDGEL